MKRQKVVRVWGHTGSQDWGAMIPKRETLGGKPQYFVVPFRFLPSL